MRYLIRISIATGALLLALFLWPSDVGSQAPALTATWRDSRVLTISWQAAEPVCVYLVGGGRDDQPLDVVCVATGSAELPTGGVSDAYAPQLREWIELRNANSQVVERLAVPDRLYRVILPIMAE